MFRFQWWRYGVLVGTSFLFLSACNALSRMAQPPVTTAGSMFNLRPEPPTFKLKPVNDQGSYFCSNGTTAFGPISQRMIQKCKDWGGGTACDQPRWSEALLIKAHGKGRCPQGSRLNQFTGFCTEGNTVLGPFPRNLVNACSDFGGGSACRTQRWQSSLFNHLARNQGMVVFGKPPQFVLLAFDGSSSLGFWNQSRSFAQDMAAQNKPVHFTYFISAVYFVSPDQRQLYNAPGGKGKGKSAIGWGGSSEEIQQRLQQVNLAYQEGHEIGSHAVGHFNGRKWSETDWTNEFKYFDQFIFEADQINRLSSSLVFDRSAIEGFRAPELGKSPGLYKTLQKQGFRYDTSKEGQANYWPQKQNGVWNFPLASLKTALTRRNVLSMDYNFYMAHSKAKPNPKNAKRYEEDMFQTYMQYFKSNFNGNRAPVHIGHHFSTWNGGAYWKAMSRFATTVCGEPEVLCVTYRDLADFMDLLTPEQIAAYQKGDFPPESSSAQSIGLKLSPAAQQQICQP
ncbi:MAG: hypothetical protein HC835_10445 [Oscillatoriales cyanobacterium RM2_1_1]|nr:hypothetical protein [Oscillatoriales cyanobacterium SM2_3_0]NJO46007.1 hypothetical protein [Oscillatoriales cyanobacterium RM2_1_1]